MGKITKKALMEEALKKYSKSKIEEAIFCNVKVLLKSGKNLENHFSLTGNIKNSKKDYIFRQIRSYLLNRKVTESNKRLSGNTGSDNIESIKINLK